MRDAVPQTGEIRSLTGLRGVAAMLVVLHHFRPTDRFALLNSLGQHGYLGVDVFFVLSGFVMAYVHHGFNGRWGEAGVLRGFLMQRAGRVYPLYIFLTLACIPLALGRLLPFKTPLSVEKIAENALLIQGWGLDLGIDPPGWSLSTEAAAYLLFPLLLAACLSRRRIVPAGAVCAVLGAYAVLAWLPDETLQEVGWRHGALNISDTRTLGPLVRCIAGFTLGILTWRAMQDARWRRAASNGLLCGATAALLLGLLFLRSTDLAVLALSPVLLGCLATERSAVARALASRPVHRLGTWSYALYLAHYPMLGLRHAATDALRWVGITRTPGLSWALVLACMIAAAALLNRFVERPAQRAIKRWTGSAGVHPAGPPDAAPA